MCIPKCFCPSCVSKMTGICNICWENPFDYVDENGDRWDICKSCAFDEYLYKQYGRGIMEGDFRQLSLLHVGGVNISEFV